SARRVGKRAIIGVGGLWKAQNAQRPFATHSAAPTIRPFTARPGTAAPQQRCGPMQMFLTQKLGIAPEMATTIGVLIALAAAVVIANLVHMALVTLLNRLAKRTASRSDDVVVARIIRPMRWILIAIALSSAQRAVAIGGWAQAAW